MAAKPRKPSIAGQLGLSWVSLLVFFFFVLQNVLDSSFDFCAKKLLLSRERRNDVLDMNG